MNPRVGLHRSDRLEGQGSGGEIPGLEGDLTLKLDHFDVIVAERYRRGAKALAGGVEHPEVQVSSGLDEGARPAVLGAGGLGEGELRIASFQGRDGRLQRSVQGQFILFVHHHRPAFAFIGRRRAASSRRRSSSARFFVAAQEQMGQPVRSWKRAGQCSRPKKMICRCRSFHVSSGKTAFRSFSVLTTFEPSDSPHRAASRWM